MSLFAPPSPFEPPSLIYLFLSSPPKFILRIIYRLLTFLRSPPALTRTAGRIRIVCISDTHCKIPSHIPDGDLLIHAGDLTNAGTPNELQAQIDFLASLPHPHKLAIAGNHDTFLDPRSRSTLDDSVLKQDELKWGKIHYLQHSSVTLSFPHCHNRKLRVYGAPQIPACGGPEFAFQYPRGTDAWSNTVPEDTDVLVTHTPPKSHLDLPVGLGCEHLLAEIWRVRPRLHVFGHVHAGRGREVVRWDEAQQSYESGCSRADGLIRSTFNPALWIDVIKVAWFGVSSLLWENVWGGAARASWLVNSSVMYINTGRLDNPAQVVEI